MNGEGDHGLTHPESWVDEHGDLMFRFALARVRDRNLAEELVQEALLAAFRSRGRFSGRASERTWLVQILRNKIADHYRKRTREVPVSELAADRGQVERLYDDRGHWRNGPAPWSPDPEELLNREEFLDALRACLDGLPERQGEVFTLRVLDDRTVIESAEIAGVTKTNLNVLLHRARAKLRECLEATWFRGEGGAA